MTERRLVTLEEARKWLRERIEDGERCPCCTQFAKVYPRCINSTMARALITLHRHCQGEFVHAPSLPGDTHETSQLAWWRLVEEEKILRPDGGRAGWWRTTLLGDRFVRREVKVPMYARIYDHRVLSLTGDPVDIVDCLGKRFDYRELMGWA